MDTHPRSFTIDPVEDIEREWPVLEPLLWELIEHHAPISPFILRDDWAERQRARYRESGAVLFVARADGSPVGFMDARITVDPSIFVERFGSVSNMYVRPAYRRRGIGSALMEAAQRWCADHGAPELRLNVVSPNRDAIDFYRAVGFEPWIIGMRRVLG